MERYCKPQARDDHRTLRRVARAMPDVVLAVDTLTPEQSPSNRYETEVVLTDDHGTVPPSLLKEIAACGRGVASVDAQGPNFVVVVR